MSDEAKRPQTPKDVERALDRAVENGERLRRALDAATESAGRFKAALEVANDRLRSVGALEVRP